MTKGTKKAAAPSWVHIIVEDMETYADPNKSTLLRVWQQTDPEATAEISEELAKGKINQQAIKNIDWTEEKQKEFLHYYSDNVGKQKLTRTKWQDKQDRKNFRLRCEKLKKQFNFTIDKNTGFSLPSGHFESTVKLLTSELEIKNQVDKLSRAVKENDGTIAVTQVFGLIQSIMKVKYPNEPYFDAKGSLHDKVAKSFTMLKPVDDSRVDVKLVNEITLAYSNFVGKIGLLRNKHSQAHGTYEFDEDVFNSGFVKSLALFAIGFYFLHFEE